MLRSVSLLAQSAPSTPPAAGQILEAFQEVFREQPGPFIIWFVASQAVSLLAYWVASRLVGAGKNGTVLNALKVYFYSILAAFLAGLLLFGVAQITGSGFAAVILALIFALILLIMAFAIPMKVYDIGFGRAFGWLLLSALFSFLGGFAVSLAFKDVQQQLNERLTQRPVRRSEKTAAELPADRPPASVPASAPGGDRVAAAPRPATERPPAASPAGGREARFDAQDRIAGDKKRPLPERQAALNELYQLLEQERVSLPPGDAGARAAFDQRRARYEGHLQRMRAEPPAPRPAK